jgi:hypothetical protein
MTFRTSTCPSATTAKPESIGPSAGAANIPTIHVPIPYGKYGMEYCGIVSHLVLSKRTDETNHVLHNRSAICKAWAPKETLKEAEEHKTSNVIHKCCPRGKAQV